MNIKHISLLSLLALTGLTTIASENDTISSEITSKPLSVRELIKERENDAAIEADYSRAQHEFFKYQFHFKVQQAAFIAIGKCMDEEIEADNVPAMNYCYNQWKPKLKDLAKQARIKELNSDGYSANYGLFRAVNKENKKEEAKAFNAVEKKLETIRTLIAQQQKAQ